MGDEIIVEIFQGCIGHEVFYIFTIECVMDFCLCKYNMGICSNHYSQCHKSKGSCGIH